MSSFDIDLVGGPDVYEFGRRMRLAPKKAQAATRRKLNTTVRPLQEDIGKQVEPNMPKGYEPVLAKSLRHRVSIKTGYWAAISMVTSAKGKSRGRKIGPLNKGVIRHPVYGRFRVSHKQKRFIPNPWEDQPVKPGFWSRPVEQGKPRIRREVSKVIVDSLRESVKG